ncbi:MAG TPA: protein-S-isoprenylcysteine O-methyltransferase [Anaerolineae bacterium]|nr:protein-S-isoprenylcysteine O-methyltransferase [Anaerolineae bacterium]
MLDFGLKATWFAFVVVGAVIRGVYVRRHGKPRITDDLNTGPDKVLLLLSGVGMQLIPIVYLLTGWLDFGDYGLPRAASLALGVVGALVFAAGVWLLWRSHAELGRNFSPTLQIVEDHALVTDGVFSRIRHPMYSAHLLWAIAQMLLLQNWIAGPAFLVVQVPFYLRRIPAEEQMMLEQFGDEYREYMGRTGRLFPRFRR